MIPVCPSPQAVRGGVILSILSELFEPVANSPAEAYLRQERRIDTNAVTDVLERTTRSDGIHNKIASSAL